MNTTSIMKMILASGSPRRHEILKKMGYDFDIIPADLEENVVSGETPEAHVKRLSSAKAEFIAKRYPDSLVVGADTIVVINDRIFGKPSDRQEAIDMLKTLSGKWHTVYTGITLAIRNSGISLSDADNTKVLFNILKEYDIIRYVESGEPMDKAGAYGIQGMGSFLVNRIEGELDTVIGFPAKLFERMYKEVVV